MRTGGDAAAIRFDVLVAARHEHVAPGGFAVTDPANQNAVKVEHFVHHCVTPTIDQADRAPHLALVIANADCLFRPVDDRNETGG